MKTEDADDPVLGLSIGSIVDLPLVDPSDVRTQEEVDQLILAAMLDQARREYAGAKLLLLLVHEHQPSYPHVEVFEAKVATTRGVAETIDRLLKTGLSDPTA